MRYCCRVKRTYTIAEAAEATGLSRKAIARRIERGSLQSVLRDGRRRVPRSELVRAGLLADADRDEPKTGVAGPVASPEGGEPYPAYPGDSVAAALFRELLNRLERQTAEIAQVRALTVQAESLALVNELSELRTRLAELEGQRASEASARPAVVSPQGVPLRRETGTMRQTHATQLWLPGQAEPHRVGAPGARIPAGGKQHDPADARAWTAELEEKKPSAGLAWGVRFAMEAIFIGAVAIALWIADVRPPVVAGVMALAWLLVALGEWAAWSRRR